MNAWAEALPTTQFLEDHAAGCYLRGAITSDWQSGERHQSDARAAVMLASAGHHVVGQRGGRPLSDRERSNLLQVVEWIEHRCIHDRLESDAEVLDTLPWYVALHTHLDKGIVPPATWLFEDLAEGVEGVRRRARPPQ